MKSFLLAMPDVGEDADFARKLDYGNVAGIGAVAGVTVTPVSIYNLSSG